MAEQYLIVARYQEEVSVCVVSSFEKAKAQFIKYAFGSYWVYHTPSWYYYKQCPPKSVQEKAVRNLNSVDEINKYANLMHIDLKAQIFQIKEDEEICLG